MMDRVLLRRIEEDSLVVAFEPLRQRKGMVDVGGEFTLAWLSLELLHMNFRHMDLPEAERD